MNTGDGEGIDNCMESITLESPAKLNLGLRIVGRRANGYHELESLFWPIGLRDRLTFSPASQLRLAVEAEGGLNLVLPPPDQNLIARALRALENDAWDVNVRKAIPVGGGLGGGSSNAGATLRFLRSRSTVSADKLAEVALKLGADVPFFLVSKPAWVTGVGEHVRPLEVAAALTTQLSFLLVLPPFGVPTKDVFQGYARGQVPFSPRTEQIPSNWDSATFFEFLSGARNDLEPFACALFPELSAILSALRDTPCKFAGLSGTGSTCFAVYQSATECENSLKVLQRFLRQHNCRSLKTETFLG